MIINHGHTSSLSDLKYLQHRREIEKKLRPEEPIVGKVCNDPKCHFCRRYLLFFASAEKIFEVSLN